MPIVVAGNKVDLADQDRQIFVEDVMDWVSQSLPSCRYSHGLGLITEATLLLV